MSELQTFFTPLHQRTSRSYLPRMVDDKVKCMGISKQYGRDYWDGNRRYGYGGYKYDGRWKQTAEKLVAAYNLTSQSKILDAGCGKAHLLYEISLLLPGVYIRGFDISDYALQNTPFNNTTPEDFPLYIHDISNPLNYSDNDFDLVISLGCIHNLPLPKLVNALAEIERVGKASYVLTESYRDDKELFNLQCWALTCESFLNPEEWLWVFDQANYKGDYEFIYFE